MNDSSARMQRLIQETESVSANNYSPLPVVIARGEGVWVYDTAGTRYLDCISAYSSLNQGHCHPAIIEALTRQASRLTLTSRALHNDRMGPFLDKLTELARIDRALPMNTGAEAVETAIKLARKWAYRSKGVAKDQARIIVCRNNFHGRTSTIVGFSSDSQYRDDFGPFAGGFDIVDFNDIDAMAAAIQPETAAILIEPVQAEAGIIVPSAGYLSQVRDLCNRHHVLFMLDEIQTGLGRTGRMFAYDHDTDAAPDVLILGKALGGGVYPVSAVLAASEVMDIFQPGDHGSTFGGNPLAASVGIAALDVIAGDSLPQHAQQLGARLLDGLRSIRHKAVVDIRGKGLLIGIELDPQFGTAAQLALRLLERKVLAKDTHSQVLRVAPPLIIEEQQIDWLLEQLVSVISSLAD